MAAEDHHRPDSESPGAPDEPTVSLELLSDSEFERSDETASLRSHRSRPRRSLSRRMVLVPSTAAFLVLSTVVALATTDLFAGGPGGVGFVNEAGVASLPQTRATRPEPSVAPEPEPETATAAAPSETATATPEPPPPPAPVTQTVGPGESLGAVAARCGIAWRRLFDANPDVADPQVLYPGQVLRCPAPDEQIAERPLPEPEPEPEPAEDAAPAANPPVAASAVPSDSVWDRLAQCESGGRWNLNTGNGYYGGLQFSPQTWRAVGGSGLPHEHSREVQIHYGQILQERSGWGQWPHCSKKLGLR